jgi:hypothetical protein
MSIRTILIASILASLGATAGQESAALAQPVLPPPPAPMYQPQPEPEPAYPPPAPSYTPQQQPAPAYPPQQQPAQAQPPAQTYPPPAQQPAQAYPPPAQGYPPPAQQPAQGYPPPQQPATGYPQPDQGYPPPQPQAYPPPQQPQQPQAYPPPQPQAYPPPQPQGYPPPQPQPQAYPPPQPQPQAQGYPPPQPQAYPPPQPQAQPAPQQDLSAPAQPAPKSESIFSDPLSKLQVGFHLATGSLTADNRTYDSDLTSLGIFARYRLNHRWEAELAVAAESGTVTANGAQREFRPITASALIHAFNLRGVDVYGRLGLGRATEVYNNPAFRPLEGPTTHFHLGGGATYVFRRNIGAGLEMRWQTVRRGATDEISALNASGMSYSLFGAYHF